MIKSISSVLFLSALLVGCGGDDDDDKKPNTSSAMMSSSSAPASVAPSSVALSSVAPSSTAPSSVAPSSVAPSSVAPSSAAPSSIVAASSEPMMSSAPASSAAASSAPAAVLSVDFEADAEGSTYGGIGWVDGNVTATVVTVASVTGLPANGASTNVLKVAVADYNSAPLFDVTLPSGKTLNDYNVKVDAYFPRGTLGLTDAPHNYYKPFLFLADTTLTGASAESNAAFQSKIETDWDDVDAWQTFTFTPDATKAASLTGSIQVSIGINRPATTNDAYYFDNVRLEPK